LKYFTLLSMLILSSFYASASNKDVSILVQENSFSSKIISDFEKKTGISVKLKTYRNRLERDVLLVESNGHGFDIIMLDHASVEKYKRAQWINEFTIQKNSFYNMVTWNYGSIVMLVHESVADDIKTWNDFYSHCFKSEGRISVIDNPHITVNTSLISINLEINTDNKLNLNQIKRNYFNTCHFELNSFDKYNSEWKNDYAAIMINDDVAKKITNNIDNYVINTPKKTINWLNYLTITNSANNSRYAKKLLKYLSIDKQKNKNSKEVGTKMILNNKIDKEAYILNLSYFKDSLLSKTYTDIHYLIYVN
jgi:spermidine/putrescine-binding protein